MSREDNITEIEKHLIGGLLRVSRQHAARSGIELSTIGDYAVGDGRLFMRIETGGSMTVRQFGRLLQWIYDRWPDDEMWPVDMVRPGRRRPVVQAPVRRGRPRTKS